MWILAVDVRDGQRLAFPQMSAAVTFDMGRYRKRIEDELAYAQRTKGAAIRRVHAEIELNHTPRGADKDQLFGFKEQLQAHVDQVSEQITSQLATFEKRSRQEMVAEALIFFGDKVFPVRAVSTTADWDEVTSYTSRTEKIDTSLTGIEPPSDEP